MGLSESRSCLPGYCTHTSSTVAGRPARQPAYAAAVPPACGRQTRRALAGRSPGKRRSHRSAIRATTVRREAGEDNAGSPDLLSRLGLVRAQADPEAPRGVGPQERRRQRLGEEVAAGHDEDTITLKRLVEGEVVEPLMIHAL